MQNIITTVCLGYTVLVVLRLHVKGELKCNFALTKHFEENPGARIIRDCPKYNGTNKGVAKTNPIVIIFQLYK